MNVLSTNTAVGELLAGYRLHDILKVLDLQPRRSYQQFRSDQHRSIGVGAAATRSPISRPVARTILSRTVRQNRLRRGGDQRTATIGCQSSYLAIDFGSNDDIQLPIGYCSRFSNFKGGSFTGLGINFSNTTLYGRRLSLRVSVTKVLSTRIRVARWTPAGGPSSQQLVYSRGVPRHQIDGAPSSV